MLVQLQTAMVCGTAPMAELKWRNEGAVFFMQPAESPGRLRCSRTDHLCGEKGSSQNSFTFVIAMYVFLCSLSIA